MPRRNSRARKRPTRKPAPSKIQAAQKSAFERREERKDKRDAEKAAEKARRAKLGLPETGALGPTRLEARDPNVIQMQRGLDQDKIAARDREIRDKALQEQADRDKRVRGLGPIPGTGSIDSPLTNPALYSRSAQQEFDAGRLAKTKDGRPVTLQQVQQQAAALKAAGSAVYMGKSEAFVGGESDVRRYDFQGGARTRPRQPVQYDNFVTLDQLMSWLADPARVDDIKKRAQAAGLNVESYDDISKLWGSAITMAAKTYQTTGRKVTPWDIMAIRGRHVDPETGKPKKKTGRSVTIEDIDPATARLMIEDAVKKMTGERPSEDQLDAFVAKARQIARQTPLVETFEQEVGFDEEPVENTFSITSREGGQEVAQDRFEVAMLDQLRRSPEYAQYRSSAFYGPLLFEALNSPVG